MRFFCFLILLVLGGGLSACSIFTCARDGRVLAGANEDGDFPFTYARFAPTTGDRYGAVYFGYADMQGQAGLNVHGLFYDFAAIPEIAHPHGSAVVNCESLAAMRDVLHTCKNVSEVLALLERTGYPLPASQLLIADAHGDAAVVNAADVMRKPAGQDYLITTNFDACDVATGNYDCLRYDIIDAALRAGGPISVAGFQRILADVHQEGGVATVYSTVCDLQSKKVYLNLDHRFTRTVALDLREELTQGDRVIALTDLDPEPSYAATERRHDHPQYFREQLTNVFASSGPAAGRAAYDSLRAAYPGRADELRESLLEVPFYLLARTRALTDGQPLFLYWHPELHACAPVWAARHEYLDTALALAEYLERSGVGSGADYLYEVRGYLHLVRGEPAEAEAHYRRALDAGAPDDAWRRRRLTAMLKAAGDG